MFFLVTAMNPTDFAQIRECVAREDRAEAMRALREAIEAKRIVARDGIELMLALRQGSHENAIQAVDAVKLGLPGAYRFMPTADHAFV